MRWWDAISRVWGARQLLGWREASPPLWRWNRMSASRLCMLPTAGTARLGYRAAATIHFRREMSPGVQSLAATEAKEDTSTVSSRSSCFRASPSRAELASASRSRRLRFEARRPKLAEPTPSSSPPSSSSPYPPPSALRTRRILDCFSWRRCCSRSHVFPLLRRSSCSCSTPGWEAAGRCRCWPPSRPPLPGAGAAIPPLRSRSSNWRLSLAISYSLCSSTPRARHHFRDEMDFRPALIWSLIRIHCSKRSRSVKGSPSADSISRRAEATVPLSPPETTRRKGDCTLSAAAMVRIMFEQPRMVPRTSIFPMCTSTGSIARMAPRGVSSSRVSNAWVLRSVLMAARRVSVCGGSMKPNCLGSMAPPASCFIWRTTASSRTRWISGRLKAGKASNSDSL
mmetsp:Transcript_25161/g.70325  ORF Transcript_25161/g.70325 Transcript_25161/m.70325 type:complete len:397 (-) Transcript_25161:2107-3297(-)